MTNAHTKDMQTYVTAKTLEVIADFMEAYPKETKQLNENAVGKDEYKNGLLQLMKTLDPDRAMLLWQIGHPPKTQKERDSRMQEIVAEFLQRHPEVLVESLFSTNGDIDNMVDATNAKMKEIEPVLHQQITVIAESYIQ